MSLQAILALVLLSGAFASGWAGRSVIAQRDQAKAVAEQAAAINRRQIRTQETSDAAYLQARARVAVVRRADAVGNGLRLAAKALAVSAPADHCEATSRALLVCTDMLGVVESAGRNMALTATERGDAGAACERIETLKDAP